eukprot:2644425-Pyramimonas_sp.AAC.2
MAAALLVSAHCTAEGSTARRMPYVSSASTCRRRSFSGGGSSVDRIMRAHVWCRWHASGAMILILGARALPAAGTSPSCCSPLSSKAAMAGWALRSASAAGVLPHASSAACREEGEREREPSDFWTPDCVWTPDSGPRTLDSRLRTLGSRDTWD